MKAFGDAARILDHLIRTARLAACLLMALVATDTLARPILPQPLLAGISGAGPSVVADLDADGDEDIAIGCAGANVCILLNDGTGEFSSPLKIDVGNEVTSLRAGHLDTDVNLDLLVLMGDSSEILTLLGDGAGSFTPQMPRSVGDGPRELILTFLNGDAYPDAVFVNAGSDDLSVLLGMGDGAFGVEARINSGGAPRFVASGLLNGDGITDLAVSSTNPTAVITLLGQGDGTFAAPSTMALARRPAGIAVGNLDGDGDVDLVVAYDVNGSFQADNRFQVLLGDGTGALTPGNEFIVGDRPVQIVLQDLDGDLDLDAVTLNTGSDDLSILKGHGNGTFAAESRFQPRGRDHPVAHFTLGSMDGDGVLDVLFSFSKNSTRAGVAFGRGDATFKGQGASFAAGPAFSVDLGDVDLDGQLDVATAGTGKDVKILPGAGDGSFASPAFSLTLPDNLSDVVLADFNGDGLLDLALAKSLGPQGGVWVLRNLGGWAFGIPQFFEAGTGAFQCRLGVGDLNADGRLDLFVPSKDDARIVVLLGNGDGTFEAGAPYRAGDLPRDVRAADFNEDGFEDLVVTNRLGHGGLPEDFSILLGRGDGTLMPEMVHVAGIARPHGVVVTDLNADGHADLLIGSEGAPQVAVHLGAGDGSFVSVQIISTESNPIMLVAGDLDLDGVVDLATSNWPAQSETVSFFAGAGEGTFGAPSHFHGGELPTDIAAVDLDENGTLDLVTGNWAANTVTVLLSEAAPGPCLDGDGDGFGSPGNPACPGGPAPDCNDTDPLIYPGAVEVCDLRDNDCDLKIDEGHDADGDKVTTCNGDCNDTLASVHRFAVEICNDGLDNDCDGFVDAGVPAPGGSPMLTVALASLSWTRPSSARVFDVIQGDALALHASGGDLAASVQACLADESRHTEMEASAGPGPGQIHWYLVRGGNCSGAGSYSGSGPGESPGRDAELASAALACP